MTKGERNWGIDLLRLVSMFMIVLLHVLGQGGILGNVVPFSKQYFVAWLLESASYCAVNCYALISGYVGIYSQIRYSKLTVLWMQMVFYNICITIFFYIENSMLVNKRNILEMFLPITSEEYWYLTAYFGMCMFIPLVNSGIKNLQKKEYEFLIGGISLLIITFTCFVKIYPVLLDRDPFKLYSGYSMIWLMILYIIGGYIRKYKVIDVINMKIACAGFLCTVGITWVSKCITDKYVIDTGISMSDVFLNYTSPTIVMAGIFLFIFFAKIDIKNTKIVSLIRITAPASLGVYILHVNPFVWENWISGFVANLAGAELHKMIFEVFFYALVIFGGGIVIELARIYLFRLCKVENRLSKIEKQLFEKAND